MLLLKRIKFFIEYFLDRFRSVFLINVRGFDVEKKINLQLNRYQEIEVSRESRIINFFTFKYILKDIRRRAVIDLKNM